MIKFVLISFDRLAVLIYSLRMDYVLPSRQVAARVVSLGTVLNPTKISIEIFQKLNSVSQDPCNMLT
jgi:hypothetical protein